VTQPAPKDHEYEDWRLLQEVLEERDREYWEGAFDDRDDLEN
jgi:hypothetical protein